MIRIQQLKIKPGHSRKQLIEKAARQLKIRPEEIGNIQIWKRSIDARKKPDIWYSYVVDVTLSNGKEDKVIARCKDNNIAKAQRKVYQFPKAGEQKMLQRPVIIGTGPAGLFCGYMLKLPSPFDLAGDSKGFSIEV